MKIFIDIDNTICFYNEKNTMDYSNAIPYDNRIKKINELYDEGNIIVYWTARGTVTQIPWFNITYNQLKNWGCKFNELEWVSPLMIYLSMIKI